MKKETTEIFRSAPIPKAVLVNIIPSIVSMMMVLVYNLADTYFIGQTKNPYMVAAVSIATPAFLIFMAVGLLFGVGGTSLISRSLGEGNQEKAKKISSFCFWTGLGVGIVSMIFVFFGAEKISMLVGASEATLGYAKQYLQIISVGIPFVIVGSTFSQILRAEGKAKTAMTGMIIGNVINMVLDPIMIIGFGWDVAGAAIATVLGNVFSFGFYLWQLLGKNTILSLKISDYTVRKGIASGVFAIGIPASLNSVMMSTSNMIVNNLIKTYGDMAVAGLGVAMKVNMIVVMLLIGLGTGIQPLLGYNFGAGNRKRFLGVLKFSAVFATGLSLVMTVICYTGARPMVNAFLENKDALTFGMQFARIYILSGPIMGLMFVLINTLQSMGAAGPSLLLSVSRQGVVYIPLVFIFSKVFDSASMLVTAQPIADYIAVVLAFILFIYTFRKRFSEMERVDSI